MSSKSDIVKLFDTSDCEWTQEIVDLLEGAARRCVRRAQSKDYHRELCNAALGGYHGIGSSGVYSALLDARGGGMPYEFLSPELIATGGRVLRHADMDHDTPWNYLLILQNDGYAVRAFTEGGERVRTDPQYAGSIVRLNSLEEHQLTFDSRLERHPNGDGWAAIICHCGEPLEDESHEGLRSFFEEQLTRDIKTQLLRVLL